MSHQFDEMEAEAKRQLAAIQGEYLKAAKPYVDTLVKLQSIKTPAPIFISAEFAPRSPVASVPAVQPVLGDKSSTNAIASDLSNSLPVMAGTFQHRVQPWMMACFGAEISADRMERNHRFFEESTELVQANGMTRSEAHQLVDYVFGRPVGEPTQEVGGVMVTLAALCLANGMNMHETGEVELARIWTKVEKIRAKQAAKPKHSPLPEAAPVAPVTADSLQQRLDAALADNSMLTAKLLGKVAPVTEREAVHFGECGCCGAQVHVDCTNITLEKK